MGGGACGGTWRWKVKYSKVEPSDGAKEERCGSGFGSGCGGWGDREQIEGCRVRAEGARLGGRDVGYSTVCKQS